MRLPAIEDPKELAAAVRFQAQEEMPMPLEGAVLDHQVVGGVPGEDGSPPQIDVVVVAARQEMISSFLRPLRDAGLEPVGIDLSAFGMIRALAGVGDAGRAEASPAEGQPGDGRPESGAVLYCSVGDITNLAVARGRACLFTRVSHVGLEPITARLAAERALSLEHAEQWLAHVGLEPRSSRSRATPRSSPRRAQALEAGVTALVDELRLSLDYYRAKEGALPVERILLCGPGAAIPGLSGADGGGPRPADLHRCAAGARRSRRGCRGTADPSLRPRAGGLMRPVNLIPQEERRGEHAAMRSGPLVYIVVGLLVAVLAGVSALVLTNNQIAERKAEAAQLRQEDAAEEARAQRLAAYTQFRALHDQRLATVASLADSRFDWERVMRELSLVLPTDVWLTALTATAAPGVSVEAGSSCAGSSSAAGLRASAAGPALEMAGCAVGHEAVAGFVTALKDIDGVTRVGVQTSALGEEVAAPAKRPVAEANPIAARAGSSPSSRSSPPSTRPRSRRSRGPAKWHPAGRRTPRIDPDLLGRRLRWAPSTESSLRCSQPPPWRSASGCSRWGPSARKPASSPPRSPR